MKIHYFQRYHSKENVVTANAMLLLSRLYLDSSDRFYELLKERFFQSSVELSFILQERGKKSVPDACIFQPSFRIVVETKLYGQFTVDQLSRHLDSFGVEDHKILLTLDRDPISEEFRKEVQAAIDLHDKTILYKHMSFDDLIKDVENYIDDRNVEMKEILDDFREFCSLAGLLANEHRMMHVRLAGTTFDFNRSAGLYYDNAERGFSKHRYLGLYTRKAVRAIGKIQAIAVASMQDGRLVVQGEEGTITDDMKHRILLAMEDAKRYSYDLTVPNRYFFVDQFVETLFEKKTPNAPMGTRIFDLADLLNVKELPSTEAIAEALKTKTW